ncbi:MAG: MarR family transcriptional regulator [Desulfobacteraceae bacterium]|nr:MAG: MarR family transcriptional regulator [Desulfobacteraceae bacterium]
MAVGRNALDRQESEERMAAAFGRIINALSTGKKPRHDFGTGDLLSPAEIHLVAVIGKMPGLTASQIVPQLGITKGAVSQSLKKLVRKGYVDKSPKADNLREHSLMLTPKGRKAFSHHEKQEGKLIRSLREHLKRMETRHLESVTNLLNELHDHIQRRRDG